MLRKFIIIVMSLALCLTTLACGSPSVAQSPNQTVNVISNAKPFSYGKYPVQQANYDNVSGEYSLMLLNTSPGTFPVLRRLDVPPIYYSGMILKKLSKIINSERDIAWGNGHSRRFLIEKDGMGYSLTDTIIDAGTESLLEYKNHREACYCIEGQGEVEANGIVYSIEPGIMYALDQHDKHYLRANTTLRLICVFTPPLKGKEFHRWQTRESSSY